MKKYIIFIFLLISIYILLNFNIDKHIKDDIPVMGDIRTYNLKEMEYELIFEDEILNLSNFKLKLATFISYNSKIKRIYIDYPNSVKEYFNSKEYFSFNDKNINEGIELIKAEYKNILEKNNLYQSIDNFSDNNIIINKVIVQSGAQAIEKFKSKYPNVKVYINDN